MANQQAAPLPPAPEPDDGLDLNDNPALEGGPGLHRQAGVDKAALVSLGFGIVGLIPDIAVAGLPNAGRIGPFAFPVLFAIVAVLFAVIAYFRYMDLGIKLHRNLALAGGILGLARLFLYPVLAAFG